MEPIKCLRIDCKNSTPLVKMGYLEDNQAHILRDIVEVV